MYSEHQGAVFSGTTEAALFAEGSVNQVQNIWRIDVNPQTLRWQSAERLTGGTGPDVGAALSRDGRQLAFTTLQRTARLWSFPYDTASGELTGSGVPVTPEDGNVVRFALSSDGRLAAYSFVRTGKSGLELWVADLDAGTRELFATDALTGAWSPDGRTLAYVLTRAGAAPSGERAVALREIGGPERIAWRWSRTAALPPTDWTPDGRALVGNYTFRMGRPNSTRGSIVTTRGCEASSAGLRRLGVNGYSRARNPSLSCSTRSRWSPIGSRIAGCPCLDRSILEARGFNEQVLAVREHLVMNQRMWSPEVLAEVADRPTNPGGTSFRAIAPAS